MQVFFFFSKLFVKVLVSLGFRKHPVLKILDAHLFPFFLFALRDQHVVTLVQNFKPLLKLDACAVLLSFLNLKFSYFSRQE